MTCKKKCDKKCKKTREQKLEELLTGIMNYLSWGDAAEREMSARIKKGIEDANKN